MSVIGKLSGQLFIFKQNIARLTGRETTNRFAYNFAKCSVFIQRF